MSRKVTCPTCGKPVQWSAAQPWRPFCSERCRLIDLGAWADGSHTIAGEPADIADWPADDGGDSPYN